MKIEYKIGDLLEADEPAIIHGCNARGEMGAGFAKALRARYPRAYEIYRNEFDKRKLFLGQVIWADCGRHIILNAITQSEYGNEPGKQYVNYDAVRAAMRQANRLLQYAKVKPTRIAMPKIGAGLGGGSWPIIEAIIEEQFDVFQPVVYVLT